MVGVPHPDFGEAVTAVVVPRAGASPSEAELIAALKSRLANFKVPKRVYVVEELPRNAMGKVQKNVLRERYRTRLTCRPARADRPHRGRCRAPAASAARIG